MVKGGISYAEKDGVWIRPKQLCRSGVSINVNLSERVRHLTRGFVYAFRRGSMLSTAIFVYAATSPVNGYFGGSLYAKQGGK